MKKVVLLGDSIRQIGYGTKVPSLLGPGYTVCSRRTTAALSPIFYAGFLTGLGSWKALI